LYLYNYRRRQCSLSDRYCSRKILFQQWRRRFLWCWRL